MKALDDQTLTLLGGALTQAAADALLELQAHNLQRMCNKLTDLPHHQSLYVLKQSFRSPRFNYLLRVSPCFKSTKLRLLDDILRATTESLLNIQLYDDKWLQALSTGQTGGLGIQSANQLSVPAFASSAVGCESSVLSLLEQQAASNSLFNETCAIWSSRSGQLDTPTSTLQKE